MSVPTGSDASTAAEESDDLQPQASPEGYVPIFLGFAALAVGFVYLDEGTQIRLTSS